MHDAQRLRLGAARTAASYQAIASLQLSPPIFPRPLSRKETDDTLVSLDILHPLEAWKLFKLDN